MKATRKKQKERNRQRQRSGTSIGQEEPIPTTLAIPTTPAANVIPTESHEEDPEIAVSPVLVERATKLAAAQTKASSLTRPLSKNTSLTQPVTTKSSSKSSVKSVTSLEHMDEQALTEDIYSLMSVVPVRKSPLLTYPPPKGI